MHGQRHMGVRALRGCVQLPPPRVGDPRVQLRSALFCLPTPACAPRRPISQIDAGSLDHDRYHVFSCTPALTPARRTVGNYYARSTWPNKETCDRGAVISSKSDCVAAMAMLGSPTKANNGLARMQGVAYSHGKGCWWDAASGIYYLNSRSLGKPRNPTKSRFYLVCVDKRH